MPNAKAKDGKARGAGGKAQCTPPCCGGIKGCCFCVDDLDEGPSPCQHFPPTCNQARVCCCGSKVLATVLKVRKHNDPGVGDVWTRTSTELYEVEITGPNKNGQCVTTYKLISATYHFIGTLKGNFFDITNNQQDPRILDYINVYRNRLCRPEPAELSGAMQVETLAGPWIGKLKGGECSANLPDERWDSGGSCKQAFIERYIQNYDNPNFPFDYTERVDLTVQTLEDKCCGDPGITPVPGLPGENLPARVPGVPGLIRLPDNQFRWFGMVWDGIPYPLRWWYGIRQSPGCGCIVAVKTRWTTVKDWLTRWKP